MDKLYEELDEKQHLFHETLENNPLFSEQLDDILNIEIKEINDLIDKNDDYYLKKALRKIDDLIEYIKNTSEKIKALYNEYDKQVKIWEETIVPKDASSSVLDKINSDINKANVCINKHSIKDIEEAINLLKKSIKRLKEY